jgi:hypothetical protein
VEDFHAFARGCKWLLRALFAKVTRSSKSTRIIRVKTTTIDQEFPGRTIDFMKIDVQGGEANVLRGAKTLLDSGNIRLLYVEWSGERTVLEILNQYGYELFDSIYVVRPRRFDLEAFNRIGFELVGQVDLSVGQTAYEMVLRDKGISPAEAMDRVRKSGLGWIHTDLIAVSPGSLAGFWLAAEQYALRVPATAA